LCACSSAPAEAAGADASGSVFGRFGADFVAVTSAIAGTGTRTAARAGDAVAAFTRSIAHAVTGTRARPGARTADFPAAKYGDARRRLRWASAVSFASHAAGSGAGALPMGARLRLKASKDLSPYPPYIRNIFRAMQRFGLIVADNGSDMYITGAMDSRWNNGELNPAFRNLTANDFEVVQLGWR
jgi:hypothetical protein